MKTLNCILLCLIATTVQAHEQEHLGYVGGSAGESLFVEQSDSRAYKVFIAGKLNPYIGLEISAINFGKSTTVNGLDTTTYTVAGANPSLAVYLPLGFIQVFAKVGALFWESEQRINNEITTEYEDVNASFGGGINLYFSDRFWLRGEIEQFSFDNQEDITLTTVGIGFDL